MKKLLLVTLDFAPVIGGVSNMYLELCRALPPDKVVVWAPPAAQTGPAAPPSHPLPSSRAVNVMGSLRERHPQQLYSDHAELYEIMRQSLIADRGWLRWRTGLFALYKHLKQNKDVEPIAGQVLPIGTIFWLLSFVQPIRYSVIVHAMDITGPMQNFRQRWLLRRVLKKAYKVFAANEYVAELVEQLGVHESQIILLPVWPKKRPVALESDIIAARQSIGATHQTPILLTIARLVKRKGHDIVLQALETVWEKHPDLVYVIIGDGPERDRLREIAQKSARPNQVKFAGEVNDETVACWLATAAIFIMTPHSKKAGDVEGYGIVYLESGLSGLPVIGSDNGAVSKSVLNEVNGLLVSENDVAGTAAAIIRLLDDENLRKQLGEKGREIALERTPEKSAAILLQAYD